MSGGKREGSTRGVACGTAYGTFTGVACWITLAVLFLSLGWMAGCADPEPGEDEADLDTLSADTAGIVSEQLPAGRFQVPTVHTPAPDFFITLPEGYTIRSMSQMPNDQFFIVRTDDPSLRDSGAVTPGFMRLYVGVNAQGAMEPGRKHDERNVMIAGFPLTWKIWNDPLPGGAKYHASEISSSDFFASISPELAQAPLHLHVYIAGADTARVSELMAAAQTLSISP